VSQDRTIPGRPGPRALRKNRVEEGEARCGGLLTPSRESEDCTYFFLEVVRAREHDYLREESSFMRKMRGFLAYHRDGGLRRRWKVSNFRVVTVAPTRPRAANLCPKMTDARMSFKRFWFTDLSQFSIDQPDRILTQIILTPKDHIGGLLYSFRD
jgi:hypothetical protein